MKQYLRGLLQVETNNRDRLEEVVLEANHQALPHRLSESAWEERAVLEQVAQEANRQLGGHPDSSLIIDKSDCPKKGTQSVGVARQGCGQLDKVENFQVGVFAARGRGTEVPLLDERLFLPEPMMAMLFTLEERRLPQQTHPLLSGTDIRALLNHFLPQPGSAGSSLSLSGSGSGN